MKVLGISIGAKSLALVLTIKPKYLLCTEDQLHDLGFGFGFVFDLEISRPR